MNFRTIGRSVSIHDDRHTLSPASAGSAQHRGADGMADLAEDFDQVALVVDWLDACRNRDLAALLALYADDATFECGCGEVGLHEGRAELEAYWRPRFDALASTAFGLEEITPTADGVVLDYLSYEGQLVRVVFTFTPDGRIRQTACAPASQASREQVAGAVDEGLVTAHPSA
jgi:ketosteroid isomerase-like protein